LDNLRQITTESECVEFKHAERDFHFNDIGKYFSALSNEANLKWKDFGWLIFGIDNATKKIVGSKYRTQGKRTLDSLKKEIADKTTGRISFIEIYPLDLPEGRVIMFQIPAAPKGMPIAWDGHYYGREGESLAPLSIQEIELIRSQNKPDWSAGVCEGATTDDLDTVAITKARSEYKIKFPDSVGESDTWNDITFLNKAKVTLQGKITRTAIILLGKSESDQYISPAVAKISWILRDERNSDKDYEHFFPPFLVNSDKALAKIRNLRYRYLPDNTLFPVEINQYDSYVIRESLHNCIAHQDYEKKSRISIVEKPDELIFDNAGNFIPGSVEKAIEQDAPPRFYRNNFLATAMANLNMIDTRGGGIRKMFELQRGRFFPLPTYILDHVDAVTVKITGKIIDENYTRLLTKKTDLDINTVILLDKVQKKQKLEKAAYQLLKKQRLVEGRYPNLFVVSEIASITGNKATYIKNRAFDKEHYIKMITSFIEKYRSASRKDIDDLVLDKLSNVLNDKQKKVKINNLLYEMTNKKKIIKNIGSDAKPEWVLFK